MHQPNEESSICFKPSDSVIGDCDSLDDCDSCTYYCLKSMFQIAPAVSFSNLPTEVGLSFNLQQLLHVPLQKWDNEA